MCSQYFKFYQHKEINKLRNEKHKAYNVAINKIATHNGDNKDSQDEDRITTYPQESNISFIKIFQ